jgi:hypothetical protein
MMKRQARENRLPAEPPSMRLMSAPTRRDKFLHTWRAWKSGLRYALIVATSVRVRFTLVLDLKVPEHDETEVEHLSIGLPGWTVSSRDVDWIRCAPPAYSVTDR